MQQPTSRPVAGAPSDPIVAVLGSTDQPPKCLVPVGYRDVLRVPCAARLLAGTLIGRMPNAMAPLAIVLVSSDRSGAVVSATLAAVYLLGSAAGGPLIGRLVDRFGQPRPFATAAMVSGAALVVVAEGPRQLPWPWVLAGVAVAGAAKPPLESGLRALFGTAHGMPTREHQRTVLALDAASQEVIYVLGPLLVAGISMTLSPSAALLTTAALGMAGTALVVTAAPSRSWSTEQRRADWLGPVRSPRLRALYLAMVGAGIPIGALTPLSVDRGAAFGAPWLSGALPAVLSASAVVGGLAYGSRPWPGTASRHVSVLAVASAAGWLPIVWAGTPATALAATALPGLVMAPLLASAFLVTGHLAPPGTTTEAHALLVAALDMGCAGGAAAAGLAPTLALLPLGAASAALILLSTRRPTVGSKPPPLTHPIEHRGSLS
ncbi:MFS transporter [Streptomyces sp. NPDC091280]|uniref:MFS transporter n=1 Tax=Streptomyces sp. NPDC091280 TaxID=3365984 RepID=UPI0038049AD0